MTFDEARDAYPALGFSLYAMTPGEDVTLEVITPEGTIFTFTGPTEGAALASAFPASAVPEEPANAFD